MNKGTPHNKSQKSNEGRSNLPSSSAALLNVFLPQPSTSAGIQHDRSDLSQSNGPGPSHEMDIGWQQSIIDLEADERLARQLAEEEEIQYALSQNERATTHNKQPRGDTTVDYDADEKLARLLAQEEEDRYFSSNNQRGADGQQIINLSPKTKSNKFERKEYNPINFSNVVIHTKSSKKLAKQLSKKQNLSHVTTNNNTDTSDAIAFSRRMRSEPEPRYPHVYDALLDAKMTLASLNNHKVYLPASSARKSFPDYEEVTVKKMEKTDLIPKEKLISIADNLDSVGRVAFTSCTSLNPMQSIVFETAYKTNKNMLVAAPTGAGKTNVAMLTVLNELRNYFKPGTNETIGPNISEKFKIIYIAPMKSLATEQTDNFSTRLKSLGINARELTGDMSLTEQEISQTHIIVTTPEKYDVVTRKSKGEIDLLGLVRLLIIDEVHLLQSDRGPVLEAIVARTLRYVESSQKMTRIIGLSATLPNYVDVATFLRVNPYEGLFYFDNRFRPVPLTQTFIGVRPLDTRGQSNSMDKICYNLVLQHVMQQKQVMIFVHARNSTQKVANKLREMIQLNNKMDLFQPDLDAFPEAAKLMLTPKNKLLRDLFAIGFGVHHAGMIRHDRLLVEKLFRTGVLKVLVCTATLAWGVNFPAHAVIIRGTEIYDASAGKFVDVGLLDVMQIFGRAGRPQYDTDGHAIILTAVEKMDSYLKLLTNQTPIESNFIKHLTDNLNAEVVSGTISSIDDGMEWLRYTYLNVRLAQNPLAYGYDHYEIESDPTLATVRNRLIVTAAQQLDGARMCRYNQDNGQLEATDLGRIASHYYINFETITTYNEIMSDNLMPQDVLGLIGEAQEFRQIKYREEEANELEKLRRSCQLPIAGGSIETTKGKVSCLLQCYISMQYIETHSLISDLMYIAQNAIRIGRGLFEYALKRGWPVTAMNLLKICKMLERQMWEFHSPFRHFDLPPQVIMRLEETRVSVEQLDVMSVAEIAKLVHFPERMGMTLKNFLRQIPYVIIEGTVKPIKSNLVTIELKIEPYFTWSDRVHGKRRQAFWVWVVDHEITHQIYHSEHIKFSKEQVEKKRSQYLSVNIPLVENNLDDGSLGRRIPSEFVVYALSDEWNGCDYEFTIDCRKINIPSENIAYTKVPPNLNQLPLTVIQNEIYANIFRSPGTSSDLDDSPSTSQNYNPNVMSPLHVEHFNLLQSQLFYPIFHLNSNIMLCGPTGSGKTLLADVAAIRYLSSNMTRKKVVYITPIKSLARLKYRDWRHRIGELLNKRISIFTEENVFDDDLYNKAEMLVSSAEDFYLWLSRDGSPSKLHQIALIVFDDMHLISDRRGSHLELIIAKLNNLKSEKNFRCRFFGISNTVANPQDLACWLGIKKQGAYNFHPASSRPIQLDVHIASFPERHYGPRMASMNRPIFKAIMTHSPNDPVMIFVSSKKQCHTTALDLISLLVQSQSNQKQWLHLDQYALDSLITRIQDDTLKLSLEFGIGFLYPSSRYSDQRIVEELYIYNKIQVLICTANYTWESSNRAKLVIVKGTEHYDNVTERFVDYPPADVMQMLGKAGRPNLDSTGITFLMIRDIYKEFYKKFLHEPFPVESNFFNQQDIILRNFLLSDFNLMDGKPASSMGSEETNDNQLGQAKNDADTIARAKRHAMAKLSSTFLIRRLTKNPSYYELNEVLSSDEFLSRFLDKSEFLYDNLIETKFEE